MSIKILMVDDSSSTIELVKAYIENKDNKYIIIGAKNGDDMWKVLENIIPDLILLDIILPGDDGFQLANQLSLNEKFKRIPLIFVSSKNTGLDVREGLKLEVYDYIKKPFDEFELEARINATIKRKELEKELEEKSLKDPLTGCFNRKYFYERINQQINYYIRTKIIFSIALIDIDNYKVINDTYGHLAGDRVLIQLTDMITKQIRTYDILARYGGEEFVILYNNCVKNDAAKSIDNIKDTLRKGPPVYDKNDIIFTFSCGIVEVTESDPEQKITFESLIKIADERLYQAKHSGKDRIIIE